MAKKNDNNLVQFDDEYDPAVGAIINQPTGKELPKPEQGKGKGVSGHAGQVGIDQTGRAKVTLDLPIVRQNELTEMAQAENIAKPEVVGLAIELLYRLWKNNKISLDDFKTIAYSDKQTWRGKVILTLPDEFDFFPK